MDVLKIKTRFMKGIICKLIKTAIKKAYGFDVEIELDALELAANDDKMHIEVNAKVDVKTSDVKQIIKGFID